LLERDKNGEWIRKTGIVHRLNLEQIEEQPRWIKDPEPGRTWVWLDEAKWKSLVPAQPKIGDGVAVPEALATRLLRLTMLDTVYCFSWPWPAAAIRSKDLVIKVTGLSPERVTMTLEGVVHFEEPARTFDVSLSGVLELDRKAQAFKRIDITGLGEWT